MRSNEELEETEIPFSKEVEGATHNKKHHKEAINTSHFQEIGKYSGRGGLRVEAAQTETII